MGEHYTAPLFTGISCDATGCTESLATVPVAGFGPHYKIFMARADAAGWRVHGGRGRRVYCPAHEPRPGHTMWLVTPRG